MVDNGRGNYIRNSSIHHGFQRAVNVHATDFVVVDNNVAYDVFNHRYAWAEDGDEVLNVFSNNLGVLQRVPHHHNDYAFPGREKSGMHFSDQQELRAGVFWGQNPYNVLVNNRAAGSWHGTGFFYDVKGTNLDKITSVKETQEALFWEQEIYRDYAPSASPFAVVGDMETCLFKGNVAHSIYRSPLQPGGAFYPSHSTGWALFIPDLERKSVRKGIEGLRASEDYYQTCTFQGFTAYKTQLGGAWLENGSTLVDSIIAESENAALLFDSDVRNTFIIGETANTTGQTRMDVGSERPQFGRMKPKDREVDFSMPNPGGLITSPGEKSTGLGDVDVSVRVGITPHFENIVCYGVPTCIESARHLLTQESITLKNIRCDTPSACMQFRHRRSKRATGSAIDVDGSVTGRATMIIDSDADVVGNPNAYVPVVVEGVNPADGSILPLPPTGDTPPAGEEPPANDPPKITPPSLTKKDARRLKRLERRLARVEKRLARRCPSEKTAKRACKRLASRRSKHEKRIQKILQRY